MKSCKKIKARDIVPGWPRGRSTVGADRMSWFYHILFFRHLGLRVPFLCSYGDLQRYEYDSKNFNFELEYETVYRQMQQAMVDEFRKNGKAFYTEHIDALISRALPGELGRIVSEAEIDGKKVILVDL